MTARRPVRPYRTLAEDRVDEAFTSSWTPTEDEFTQLMLDVADRLGWPSELRYHTHDSRRSAAGFPDWTLVHPAQYRVLFLELKGWRGVASEAQRRWIGAINAAGGEAYLVTTTGDYAHDAAALADLLGPKVPRGTPQPQRPTSIVDARSPSTRTHSL